MRQLAAGLVPSFVQCTPARVLRVGHGQRQLRFGDAAEDEVEKFREFLDQINPDDFLG